MMCSTGAVRYLQQVTGTSSQLDIDTLLGELGTERADLRLARDRGREQALDAVLEEARAVLQFTDEIWRYLRSNAMERMTAADQGRAVPKTRPKAPTTKPTGTYADITLSTQLPNLNIRVGGPTARVGVSPPTPEQRRAVDAGKRVMTAVQLLQDDLPNRDMCLVCKTPTYVPSRPPSRKRCGRCGERTVTRLNRTNKIEFMGCSTWPACNWTQPFADTVTAQKAVEKARAQAPDYARRALDFGDDEEDNDGS